MASKEIFSVDKPLTLAKPSGKSVVDTTPKKSTEDTAMEQAIARVLRFGVGLAALLAAIGGALYLFQHGSEPARDYSTFSYDDLPAGFESYTTLGGILTGFFSFTATGWIQLGVLVLLLTPIVRVLLSLLGFARQRDWLYVGITAFVLAVIVANSLGF